MKYIKEYSKSKNTSPHKYKKGDYVFINYSNSDITIPFGQVRLIKVFNYMDPDYYVDFIYNNKIVTHKIPEYFLSRKMTKKEIEEFETIKSSIKYNI